MDNRIVLIGAGAHCAAVMDVLHALGLEIYGLITPNYHESQALGLKYLGTDAALPEARKNVSKAIIALMQYQTIESRILLFSDVEKLGFELPAIVSPHAHIAYNATLGKGTAVMHRALINSSTSVGDNCIIGANTLVEPNSSIGSHCSISSGVLIGAGVKIGSGTYIGEDVIITDECEIGENCHIKPGSRVRGYVESGTRCRYASIKGYRSTPLFEALQGR